MTTLASNILDQASALLFDIAAVHWPRSELLTWLNDGQRAIVELKPDAGATLATVKLTAGTKQPFSSLTPALNTAGANGSRLLRVIRNMGTTGSTPGRAPRITSFRYMDFAKPDWHAATADATVEHFLIDENQLTTFWVYPPQPSANQGYLEIQYARVPQDLSSETENIDIGDQYRNPLIDYLLFKAYTKGIKQADANTANGAYGRFLQSLGLQNQAEAISSPLRSTPDADPAAGGLGQA